MKKHHIIADKKGQQLSKMIIGLVLTVAISMGFFLWISAGINTYGVNPPSGYNESFLKVQGIYGNLSQNVNSTYEELQDISSQTSGSTIVDFLGFFFSAAYRAAGVAAQSVGSMFSIGDVSVDSVPLGTYGDTLKGLFFLGILVIMGIAILLRLVTKSGAE